PRVRGSRAGSAARPDARGAPAPRRHSAELRGSRRRGGRCRGSHRSAHRGGHPVRPGCGRDGRGDDRRGLRDGRLERLRAAPLPGGMDDGVRPRLSLGPRDGAGLRALSGAPGRVGSDRAPPGPGVLHGLGGGDDRLTAEAVVPAPRARAADGPRDASPVVARPAADAAHGPRSQSMNDDEFAGTIADRGARATRSEPMARAYFDRVTDIYRKSWGASFHFAIFRGDEPLAEAVAATERFIGERGAFHAGQDVLDIGCGVARPAVHFAERFGVRVTGVNLSARQIGIARDRVVAHGVADRVRFVIADGMQLPLAREAFDRAYEPEAGRPIAAQAGLARQ